MNKEVGEGKKHEIFAQPEHRSFYSSQKEGIVMDSDCIVFCFLIRMCFSSVFHL